MKDYYQILGVDKNASFDEIKRAYHRLAHKYHPDKVGGNVKKFKEINEAYQVLGNKEKRAQYDRFGYVSDDKTFRTEDFWTHFGKGAGFEFDSFGFEDLFSEFFGFKKTERKKDLRRGENIEIEMEIDLEDVFIGNKKKINLAKKIICPRCNGFGGEPHTHIKECFSCRGMGWVSQMKKTFLGTFTREIICPECKGEGRMPEKLCNVCHGEGRIDGREIVEIVIPRGVDKGQVIKFSEKGNAGRRGGRAGDLYLYISIRSHPLFQRKGDDLYLKISVSFSQLVLGDRISIPFIENKKGILEIPPGSSLEKTFKISHEGLPRFNGTKRGDLYVQLEMKIPKHLTKTQKELLKRLKEEGI